MTQLQFRALIVAYAVGLALLLTVDAGGGVPESIKEQWVRDLAQMPAMLQTILLSMEAPVFGIAFVALAGMFFFQRWARWLFLVWTLALIPACFMVSWWYESAWENARTGVLTMMQGAIIALAFWGGAFDRKSAI